MIVKKIAWLNWIEINRYIGIDIEATRDDRDENLEIKKVTNQHIENIIPKYKFIANKIPT